MRLIHPIETFKNTLNGIFRNPHSRIRYRHIKILVISVQGYSHPSIVHVIFDSVFHQIADGKSEFQLVHVRLHRPEAVQDQIYIPLVRNGTQPL